MSERESDRRAAEESTPREIVAEAAPARPEARRARRFAVAFAVGVVLVLVLRFAALGRIPPGVYVDEASYGYNAFSVAQTGHDEHGVRFPVFFAAFGEYKSPVFIYALAALVKLFGLSIVTARLCAALFVVGAAVFTALVVAELTERPGAALPTLLLVLVLPWTFTLGRFATESVSYLFLIALAWWTWLRAVRTGSAAWFAVSWTAWGLSLFSYGTARMLTPLLVLALIAAYAPLVRRQLLRCAVAAVPGLGLALVYAAWAVAHPGALTARFEEISIFRDGPSLAEAGVRLAENYLRGFSLGFLFLRGDPNLRHHTGVGGELYLFLLPALIVGLVVAVRKRRDPAFRFALTGVALFPAAAALTHSGPNAIRTVNAVPFVVALAAIGLHEIFVRWRRQRAVLASLLVLAGCEIFGYLGDYFVGYPGRVAPWFNAGLPRAVEAALKSRGPRGDEPLLYAPTVFRDEGAWVNQPYIAFLFCGHLAPQRYWTRGLAGFGIYCWSGGATPPNSILLVKSAETLYTLSGLPVSIPNREPIPPGSRLVREFRDGSRPGPGAPVYQIYRTPPAPQSPHG